MVSSIFTIALACFILFSSRNTENTTTLTTTSLWQVHRPTLSVTVGDRGDLVFSPPAVNASISTIVSFNFLGRNHTLT
ncbi:hypothetical protein BCR34DRAFT_499771 [Clohesyomyces aquaticus]|uniref:Plastocyanin-like domain-containing protein n=1 Tax=Clohesyomyces aquaticus TaxID=1231657 RepID=A0A1Y1Y6L0_9PLEO|nr:hypothetical protein BCR34DRAFT_499771 [Clohesyomyces aquaticus]